MSRRRQRRENRREFRRTGIFDVRRMTEGKVYAGDMLKDAREWLYDEDNKFERRADLKGTLSLLISIIALLASLAALAFELVCIASAFCRLPRTGRRRPAETKQRIAETLTKRDPQVIGRS
jgi:hypothetical protein